MTTATTSKQSAEERALERFGEMLISKIETIKEDWHKPWFTEGACVWARNLDGRGYNGINAFMLAMLCENKGYELPVFSTFERIAALNNKKIKDDKPLVTVKKGEKSFPVFLTTFTVIDKDGNKIPYDEYIKLSDDEKNKCQVYPRMRVYNVFNIAQTNIAEARPELFEKIQNSCGKNKGGSVTTSEEYSIEKMDYLLANQKWYCPINIKYQDSAYYSPSNDCIVLPEKSQFTSGKSFYGTAFHEMVHSTGIASRLNRVGVANKVEFGSSQYAHEELVAEIGAAITGLKYGLQTYIQKDSVAYIKSWLGSISQSPKYVKTVLKDAKKASDMIIDRLENLDKVIVKPKVA